MASGFSKRFGSRNKLLVPFRGKPLACYTLELVNAIGFSGGIYFVSSSHDAEALAADLPDIRVIYNTAPERGLRESVRLGITVADADTAYYLFFPCDMPFLDAPTVRRIIGERKPACIVEPRFNGRPGNPSLFSAFFREELLSLGNGETPRIIKARHPEALRTVEVSNPLVLEDIDDEETLNQYDKR